MAVYELVQYGCDNFGTLTEVMDPDQKIPEGWVFGESRHDCYCPECAKKLGVSKQCGLRPELRDPGIAQVYKNDD